MKNNLGRNVLALFDPPHLSKLGKFLLPEYVQNLKGTVSRDIREKCVFA